jgi:hypothetical protein
MDAIRASEQLGWILFGVSFVLLSGAAVLLSRWGVHARRLVWLAVPLIVHPGWWLSARGGDCGGLLRLGAIAVTALATLTAVLAVIAARRTPTGA